MSYHATKQTGQLMPNMPCNVEPKPPGTRRTRSDTGNLFNAALSPRKSYPIYTTIIIRPSNSIPSNEPVPAQVRCRLADEKSMLQLETIRWAHNPYSIQKRLFQLLDGRLTDREWRTSVLKYVGGVRIDCGVFRVGTV